MQKFFTLILALVLAWTGRAQESGVASFDFLKGETLLNVLFDYSGMQICGMSEEAFFASQNKRMKRRWEEAKSEDFYKDFVANANDELEGKTTLRLGAFPEAQYQATVRLISVDGDDYTKMEVVFANAATKEILATMQLVGDPKMLGAVAEIVSYALEQLGKSVGTFLAVQLNGGSLQKALPYRNPAIAFGLSAVFPGLGQYYNGEKAKGIVMASIGGLTVMMAGGAYYLVSEKIEDFFMVIVVALVMVGNIGGHVILRAVSIIDAPIAAAVINSHNKKRYQKVHFSLAPDLIYNTPFGGTSSHAQLPALGMSFKIKF
jgi:hypothetical protein